MARQNAEDSARLPIGRSIGVRTGLFAKTIEWLARTGRSSTAQLGLLCIVGIGLAVGWAAFDRPPGSYDTEAGPLSGFPQIDLEGARPVTEGDLEALIRRRTREGPSPTASGPNGATATGAVSPSTLPTEKAGRAVGAIKLTPGILVDPDSPDVQATVRAFDKAQRRHIARDHSRGSVAREGVIRPPADGPSISRLSRSPAGSARRRDFFAVGGVLEGTGQPVTGAATDDGVHGLAVGDRIAVVLEVGVSSSTAQVALASVAKAFRKRGRVVLPKGAVFSGRVSNDDQRVHIEFTQVMSNGRRSRFRAYAIEGRMPGLNARRREATYEERQSAGIARGALNVVRGVAGALGGGLPADAAKSVADETIPEARREVTPRAGFVLEVAAGRKFEVVVIESGS